MKSIRIGSVIAAKRRENGLTQEELAEYLGVSKPAVSKWESGQSCPDIALLPVIASYFGISVDSLLDYRPQMTRDEIRALYKKLSDSFAKNGFERTYEQCRGYVRQYYSCCPLLFHMGLLYLNNAHTAGELSPERKAEIIREAMNLFRRVEETSPNASLARQALHLRAMGHVMLREPDKVIDLLDDAVESPISTRVLLATAYQMNGNESRSRSLLQSSIYLDLNGILGAVPSLLALYVHEPEKMEQWMEPTLQMVKAFRLDTLCPTQTATLRLNAAYLFLNAGNREKALDNLEEYAKIVCSPGLFPLSLKSGGLFDQIDDLFESMDLGAAPPRSDEAIRQSLKDAVLSYPPFQALEGDERYKRIVRKIESI